MSRSTAPASTRRAGGGPARGVRLVLLTPRAHNPTGVSWTAARKAELVDVLAAAPDVLVIEDDDFTVSAQGPSLSLGTDPGSRPESSRSVRFENRRARPPLSVAVARGRLNTQLREAQLTTGAWTSHTAQRVLALALRDPTLADMLKAARLAYAARRRAALTVLGRVLPSPPALDLEQDGLNVWVTLPTGIDAVAVLQRAAQLGVLGSNGAKSFTGSYGTCLTMTADTEWPMLMAAMV